MTPEQALQVLQQVSAVASLPLAGHQQAQEALRVLAEAIKPKEETKKK